MKKIGSLNVLKFVAMLLIVWWHLGTPTRNIDWGARMCEFLFVASGFLVGYNYYKKGMTDSRKYSFDYTFSKIRTVWPLHILALIMVMILNYKIHILAFKLNKLPILLSNIFLLQAWSSDVNNVAFSYNGVSWFVSALFFCYYLSPFFIKFIKKIKVSLIVFIIISITRISIDLFIKNSSNIFSLSTHTSPIVRALEFFMGMLIVPMFIKLKNKVINLENKSVLKLIATVMELGTLILCYFLMRNYANVWQRSYFVLMFCIVIFIFGFDFGYFSKFCSNKYINIITCIQLEMYLLQLVASAIINKFFGIAGIELSGLWTFVVKLILLLIISFMYKFIIEKRAAKFLDKFYTFLKNICFN